jgi:hypothetical protein
LQSRWSFWVVLTAFVVAGCGEPVVPGGRSLDAPSTTAAPVVSASPGQVTSTSRASRSAPDASERTSADPIDIYARSDGCKSYTIAPDVSAAAPTGPPRSLPAPLLPGETTGTRLVLFSRPTGGGRHDAMLDVDRGTLTELATDTACGSYFQTMAGDFGGLYAPDGFADGRTQYKPRLWHRDGASTVFDVRGAGSASVAGGTWWFLGATDAVPRLFGVDLATGAAIDWGEAPDRTAWVAGHDPQGRPIVSTGGLGTFVFDPGTRSFEPTSDVATIYSDGVHRIEQDCSTGTCRAVYRGGSAPGVDVGAAERLHVMPAPDGRHLLLVGYASDTVPVDVLDTTTGALTHLADEELQFGPVVHATWSPDSTWLFLYTTADDRFSAWHAGEATARILPSSAVLGTCMGIVALPAA